ncbi:alpha/beta hydrolase [Massilia sp.]|uniref:alpha/beta hydrolase n=1 Tax=Massilia sp. TaxID=1882437 RepID=UPI00352E4C78
MSLDPVLQQLLSSVPLDVPRPVDWRAMRSATRSLLPLLVRPDSLLPVASVEDLEIPGEEGIVNARVYRPLQAAQMTLIYIHGGGWTGGDLDTVDHTVRKLCHDLPALVVSCTYRLAPEHPFPAAYDDALAAVRWVLQNIEVLGGDAASVVIAGDSAGGNLAAAVALALRDTEPAGIGPLPSIKAQLLLYPAVNLREEAFATASCLADADPALRKDMLHECRAAYLQNQSADDWRVSPLTAELGGLPPAVVVVVSVDPLRDDGVEYAARLQATGVHAELIEFPHLTHGFVHLTPVVPAAKVAFDEVIDRFRTLAAHGIATPLNTIEHTAKERA